MCLRHRLDVTQTCFPYLLRKTRGSTAEAKDTPPLSKAARLEREQLLRDSSKADQKALVVV
jgi:hypothetical protein